MQFSSNGPIRCCIPLNLLKLVVAAKGNHTIFLDQITHFEIGFAHFNAKQFGFTATGYDTAIIV